MKHELSTEPLVLRVKPSIRDALARAASDQGGRSIASVVREVLERWANERDDREAAA